MEYLQVNHTCQYKKWPTLLQLQFIQRVIHTGRALSFVVVVYHVQIFPYAPVQYSWAPFTNMYYASFQHG